MAIAAVYTSLRAVINLHDIHKSCNNCNDKGSIYTNKPCHNMSCNAHIEDAVVVSLAVLQVA